MIAIHPMVLFEPRLKLVAQFLERFFCPVDWGERHKVFRTA
jgi:hypothetical protein